MPDSRSVRIRDKHTGKVTLGKTARTAMWYKKPPMADSETIQNIMTGSSWHIGETSSFKNGPNTNGSVKNSEDEVTSNMKRQSNRKLSSLSEFISYAYSRKGQRLKDLSAAEASKIQKRTNIEPGEFEELLSLSRGDPLLAVPRLLILAGDEFDGYPRVRQQVQKFVLEVVKQHPVYAANDIIPVVLGSCDAMTPTQAMHRIASLDLETLVSLAGLQSAKPKDAEVLRTNSINLLALLLHRTRGQQINKVVGWLYEGYWRVAGRKTGATTEGLVLVTSITEAEHVGVAIASFKAEADENARRVAALQSTIESLQGKIDALQNGLDEAQAQIAARDRVIESTTDALELERSEHANTRSHLQDDRERLRSTIVRRLKDEVALLTEGLQALRREPPKIRVMDDHAERALEGLRAALKDLEHAY